MHIWITSLGKIPSRRSRATDSRWKVAHGFSSLTLISEWLLFISFFAKLGIDETKFTKKLNLWQIPSFLVDWFIQFVLLWWQVQGSIWGLAFWSPWDSMGPQKWSPLEAMWSPKFEAHNPCYFQDVLSQWSDNVIKHINLCFYCIMFYHNSKCI